MLTDGIVIIDKDAGWSGAYTIRDSLYGFKLVF